MMETRSLVREVGGAVAGPVAALLAALAVMMAVVPTSPVHYFDVDPRATITAEAGAAMNAPMLTTLGPTGLAWWQIALVALGLLSILLSLAAGARWRWRSSLLIALGVLAAAWHMVKPDALWEDWMQGGGWIAAATVGLAAAHLGQLATARRWVVAVLAALAVPLAADAVWYVLIDHPDSVRFFEENRQAIFEARGWAEGSQQAVLYERRSRFADATGTFGLSNVLASVSVALVMLGLGMLVGFRIRPWRKRITWVAAIVLPMLGAATVVWLTNSKGAAVAGAVVVGLLLVHLAMRRFAWWQRALPWLTVACVAAAFAAVLLRGAMGPPPMPDDGFVPGREPPGERSLLFRAQYWSAAAKTALDSPLLGSGGTGFAQSYLVHKDPLNPESVTSAHNVFVDFITMLGLGGWAWSILLIAWLWNAGEAVAARATSAAILVADESERTPTTIAMDTRVIGWVAFLIATLVFSISLLVRQPTLYRESALLWMLAATCFGVVVAVLARMDHRSDRAVTMGLWLSAAVVLVHNQIEMSFFRLDAMPILWLILGTAGAGSPMHSPPTDALSESRHAKRMGPYFVTGVASLALLVGMVMYAVRTQAHEAALAGAASALRRGDVNLAIKRLEVAQHAAALDTNALRWRVQLFAAEPLRELVSRGHKLEAEFRVGDAMEWIAKLESRRDLSVGIERMRSSLLRQASRLMPSVGNRSAAEEAAGRVVAKSPYNARDWLDWADLAAERGDRGAAIKRYERVLRLREQGYLDAADPLSADELRRVEAYLAVPRD